MVVEDDALAGRSLCRWLRREGHQVVLVSRLDDALRLVEGEPEFDGVLTDVELEDGASGLELLEVLRRQKPEQLKIIMSGAAIPAHVTLTPGVEAFFEKPLRLEALSALLQR